MFLFYKMYVTCIEIRKMMTFSHKKTNNCTFSYRESHCHPLEDCSHIHTATWQHRLQLSLPALQPHRSPETTVCTVLGLG